MPFQLNMKSKRRKLLEDRVYSRGNAEIKVSGPLFARVERGAPHASP